MKHHFKRNSLFRIDSPNGWIYKVDKVEEEIKIHFEKRCKETMLNIPNLDGVSLNHLSLEDRILS